MQGEKDPNRNSAVATCFRLFLKKQTRIENQKVGPVKPALQSTPTKSGSFCTILPIVEYEYALAAAYYSISTLYPRNLPKLADFPLPISQEPSNQFQYPIDLVVLLN